MNEINESKVVFVSMTYKVAKSLELPTSLLQHGYETILSMPFVAEDTFILLNDHHFLGITLTHSNNHNGSINDEGRRA